MIATEVTAVDVVAWLVFWVAVLVALWRWPGAVIGISVALALWTVAPWASWLGLVVVGLVSVAWRVWGRGARPTREGLRWLLRRPALAVLVVSAVVSAVAPEPVAPAAFVVLVVSAAAVAASWPRHEPAGTIVGQSVAGAGERHGLGPGLPTDVAGRVAERLAHVVASGPCARCDGVLVATVRLPADPTPEDLAGIVAHAGCPTCGARLVGLVDPANPRAGLVWFEMPPGEQMEDLA